MNTKLAVFDLAGTTIHDENFVARALKASLDTENIVITIQDANRVMGIPKNVAIKTLIEEKSGKVLDSDSEIIYTIYNRFQDFMIDFYQVDPAVREIDGVSETFSYLKSKGIMVAIDTGFSSSITSIIINRMQWAKNELIDAWISSDEVVNGRPYPDMIYELMKQCGVDSSANVAKIGDTEVDILEGRSAGCGLVIGVLSGAYSKEQLEIVRPDMILQSVCELRTLNII